MMKKNLIAPAALLLATGFAGIRSTSAAILYEPFNYPAGTALGGQSPDGTHTWAATNTATGQTEEPTTATPSANLTVPAGIPAPVGNSVQFGNTGLTDRIDIGDNSSGTLYYSMALKITDLGTLPNVSASNQIIAGFNNSTGTQTGNPSTIGAALWAHPDNGTSTTAYHLGITTLGGTSDRQYSTAAYNVGDTVYVIGANDFDTNQASLWVFNSTDSVPSSAPTPTAMGGVLDNANYDTLRSFLLYQQGNGVTNMLGQQAINVDELRVGTSWADVTSAVPEPASLGLLALGGLGMLRRRRRAV